MAGYVVLDAEAVGAVAQPRERVVAADLPALARQHPNVMVLPLR